MNQSDALPAPPVAAGQRRRTIRLLRDPAPVRGRARARRGPSREAVARCRCIRADRQPATPGTSTNPGASNTIRAIPPGGVQDAPRLGPAIRPLREAGATAAGRTLNSSGPSVTTVPRRTESPAPAPVVREACRARGRRCSTHRASTPAPARWRCRGSRTPAPRANEAPRVERREASPPPQRSVRHHRPSDRRRHRRSDRLRRPPRAVPREAPAPRLAEPRLFVTALEVGARSDMARYVVRVARRAGLIILFLLAAMLGSVSGVLFAFAGDLPQISALDDYAPSTITRVYGARGEVVGEFAIQRRVVIRYEDISPMLRKAILAAEDDTFFQHFGLSIPHIVVAAVKDLIGAPQGRGRQHADAAARRASCSSRTRSAWSRKIKEAILAIQIEKRYTKDEIFTLYCNQMYFGHGAYGVEAAARPVLRQVGEGPDARGGGADRRHLPGQRAAEPVREHERALRRRNYALERMAEEQLHHAAQADGREEEADRHARRPASSRPRSRRTSSRRCARSSKRATARSSSTRTACVQTALDLRLQDVANRALDDGTAPHRPAPRLPQAEAQRPRRAPHDRGLQGPRWDGRSPSATSCPRSSSTRTTAPIQLRAGAYQRHDRQEGLRVDAQDDRRAARDSAATSSKPSC